MATNPVSKTQIDRLGDRLKGGSCTELDLRLLEDYRRSFGEAYEAAVRTIRQRGESPTGRLAKSTLSIMEKLRRESIRLSQMQDIAGCRMLVVDVLKQNQLVASLETDFPGASVIDRRDKPSYGYRAVHIIAEISGKLIEIQVRTRLQHLWADLSEKSSDVLDPKIKYGGGTDSSWQSFLTKSSEAVAAYEKFEATGSKAVATRKQLKTPASIAVAAYVEFTKATAKRFGRDIPGREEQESRGKLDGAIADFTQAIEIEPRNARAYAERGLVRRDKGDLDGAIADGTQAIELDPRLVMAYGSRGLARRDHGDLDGAIADYTQAIGLNPKIAIIYAIRGGARYDQGDLEGAIADNTQAIELDPRDAAAYNNRGTARGDKGDLDGAIADYTQAIELDPKLAAAYFNRGRRCVSQSADQAFADLERAIEIDPDLADPLLASVRTLQGDQVTATRVIQQIQSLADSVRGRKGEQELLHLWNVIFNLLSGAISWLDERRPEGQRQ